MNETGRHSQTLFHLFFQILNERSFPPFTDFFLVVTWKKKLSYSNNVEARTAQYSFIPVAYRLFCLVLLRVLFYSFSLAVSQHVVFLFLPFFLFLCVLASSLTFQEWPGFSSSSLLINLLLSGWVIIFQTTTTSMGEGRPDKHTHKVLLPSTTTTTMSPFLLCCYLLFARGENSERSSEREFSKVLASVGMDARPLWYLTLSGVENQNTVGRLWRG